MFIHKNAFVLYCKQFVPEQSVPKNPKFDKNIKSCSNQLVLSSIEF